jgi:hypothetical protein
MPCKIGHLITPSHWLWQTIQLGAVSPPFLSFSAISYVLQLPLPFQRALTLNTNIFARSPTGTLLGNPILTTLNRLRQLDLLLLTIRGDIILCSLVSSLHVAY